MIDEKALERIADQASRMMAAGWLGNPHMSGDDRNFMSPSTRRRHDDKVREVVEFVLSHVEALSPGSTGETDGWQPIETAPKGRVDGILPQILLIGQFENGYTADIVQGWWDGDAWARWKHHVPPTHWRPLPEPPGAMLAAAGGREG